MKHATNKANGYGEHIIRDQRSLYSGTRVTLRTVLASLAAGEKPEKVLEQFPT
jgi:uncharacterized protein (DUF433 family)